MAQQGQEQAISPVEAKEKVKQKGQEFRGQISGRIREQAQQRASSAGEQMQSLSQTMRRTAAELRSQGQEGQGVVLDQVAIRAEQVAGYLTSADPDQLLSDARQYVTRAFQFVRQQPWLIAPVGLGVGLLAARLRRGGSTES